MSWLAQFKLGRPNAEALFEINPAAMEYDPRRLVASDRAIEGSLTAVTLSRLRPVVTINGNYITPVFRNQLQSLAMIADTMLNFEPMDSIGTEVWQSWTERIVPTDTTHLTIQDNSALRASAAKVAAGGASTLAFIGLWDSPGAAGGATGQGTERMVGPGYTYDEPTRTITLTVPLADLTARYLTYSYFAIAVHLPGVPFKTQGGMVDAWKYDLTLEGA